MRVVTWFGTRPEIIRLSRVIAALDAHCEQLLVHTGQNYDASLSDIFFRDLGVRAPDRHLGIVASDFGAQAGAILQKSYELLGEVRPDRLLILGDTNSGLAAVSAARLGIPVYHMEAGNRCYDDRVPEEVNRRIIDHSSTILMPYTQRSKDNLVREGIERQRIAVIGNPIFEVIEHYGPRIDASPILERLGVVARQYCLATLHRAENVDDPDRLRSLLEGLGRAGAEVIVSVHPRTHDKLQRFGIAAPPGVRLIEPLGFFDFVNLEKNARCVLSDSGTVQEECCIFGVPNVTLRDVTERAETIECGSNILTGAAPDDIERAVKIALASVPWRVPAEYLEPHVSQTVVKVVLGYGI
jgi:UDP-N-acetylglucosamine 2-epimerase (non-hydrolysing)